MIARARGDPHVRRIALSSCISTRAKYTGQFSAWSDKQHKQLDIPFSAAYRKLTSNTITFPTELLYLPHKYGGLGLPRTSDLIQTAKYSALQRHILSADDTISANMHTLLNNAANHSLHTYSHGTQPIVIGPTHIDHHSWVDSLTSFALLANLQLIRAGDTPPPNDPYSLVTTLHPQPSHPTVADDFSWMQSKNIHRISDLYTTTPTSAPTWNDLSKTSLTALTQLLPPQPPTSPPSLFPHQFWIPSSDSQLPPKTIAEIVGFNHNNSLFIRPWHTTTPVSFLNLATDVTRSHPRNQQGAATTTSLTPLQALGSFPRRIYLGPPSRNNNNRHSITLITSPTTYTTELHTTRRRPLPDWLTSTILDNIHKLGPYDIFTDGSWLDSGPAWNHITHNSPTYTGSAGLVLISQADNWMDLPIITLHLHNGLALDATSAYSMELLAVVTALYLLSIMDSTATIYSDCQSVINKITKLQRSTTALRASTADSTLLTTALHHLQKKNQQLQWIKGHPERTQSDEALWTREMWGNHLADRAASNTLHPPSYQYNNNSATILSISNIPPIDIAKLTPTLSPSNHWYLGKTGKQYTSKSLIDSIHTNRLNAYLLTRDEYRGKADLPPLWQTLNIPLASELWQLTTNTTNRSLCNRLLFDKHWHGRNQAKAIKE